MGNIMGFWKNLFGKKEKPFDPYTYSEPYVKVVNLNIPNPKDPTVGYFELDWNDAFVAELRRAGYKGTTDEEIVDQWFTDLCKGISAESEDD